MHAIFTEADAAKREQSFFIIRDSLRTTFTATAMVIFLDPIPSVGTRSRAIRACTFQSVFSGFFHPASAPPASSCSRFLDAPTRVARERAPTVWGKHSKTTYVDSKATNYWHF